MTVYRVAKEVYATDLSGKGAEIHGGRWNSAGNKMLYASSYASLAFLEALAWTPMSILLTTGFTLLELQCPDQSFMEIPDTSLSAEWRRLDGYRETQMIGDRWLRASETLLLRVPSVLLPIETNVLLNPAHVLMGQVRITEMFDLTIDPRLLSHLE